MESIPCFVFAVSFKDAFFPEVNPLMTTFLSAHVLLNELGTLIECDMGPFFHLFKLNELGIHDNIPSNN